MNRTLVAISVVGFFLGLVTGAELLAPWKASVIELVETLGTIVLSAVAIATVWLGYLGFNKWQPETVGRRRLEHAEALLTDIYRFRHLIQAARDPIRAAEEPEETTSRVPENNESPEISQFRDWFYMPIAKLHEDPNFLPSLFSKRYRSQALFGLEVEGLFDQAQLTVWQIEHASRQLVLSVRASPLELENTERTTRYKQAIGYMADDVDQIKLDVDKVVLGFESLLGPILMHTGNSFASNKAPLSQQQ